MEDLQNSDNGTEGSPEQAEIQAIVRARVENLRTRLLDSSRRNPLIQIPFRQNSSSLIRFVDELPDVLAERLASQNAMRLVALPPIDETPPDEHSDEFLEALEIARATDEVHLEASAALDPADAEYAQKEIDLERALKDRVRANLGLPERQTGENPSLAAHARAHDISPDYILPRPSDVHDDGRHVDEDIQTLLLPERLERVARSLHDKGHAFERETGVNVLHAAFGVLEWNEPGSSRTPARSPLLLLEVRMSRQKAPGGAEYRICGDNELGVNTTLAQTFGAQYGLELPLYEGGSIEAYFEAVAGLSPKGWHWSVRREALVGVFPSSRIAMYRDLDPDNGSVIDHPIVSSMLSSVGGDGASYAEVYDTDAVEIAQRVPHLVMDADASQFSSLVDVANGDNVAIEGPPGSGKSQTIVNLIAAAMADGKRVLFVAEKLTALDVVKNRLEAAKLGEFVLPLQAGRGSRDAVFQSLEDRMMLDSSGRGAAEAHRARHETLKRRRDEMQAYLDMLGTTIDQTGMTVHEALGRAIATAPHLEGLPREIRRLRIPGSEWITPEARRAIEGDVRMVVDRLNDADRIAALWRDAGKAPLRTDDAEDIAIQLSGLGRAIETLRADVEDTALRPFLSSDVVRADEGAVMRALNAIAEHPDCDADLATALLDPEMRRAAEEVCSARDAIHAAEEYLSEVLTDPRAEGIDATIEEAMAFARRHDGVIDPAALTDQITSRDADRRRRIAQRDLALALPARWAETAAEDGTTLADLRLDLEMLLRAPQDVLDRRQPDDARTLPSIAREAAATQAKLTGELEQLRKKLSRAGAHSVADIETAASAIEGAGLFRAFSGRYKAARAFFSDACGGYEKTEKIPAAAYLREYAAWAKSRDAFAGDARLSAALGASFKGVDSDPEHLGALANFHETVSRISRGDERLRYALETGPLAPLRTYAAETEMPTLTLEGLTGEIEKIETMLEAAREDRRRATDFCLFFENADRVEAGQIHEASRARHTRGEAIRQIEASIAADLLAGISDTETARVAISLAAACQDLPDPSCGLNALRQEAGSAILEAAKAFFAGRADMASSASSIAEDIALAGCDAEEDDGLVALRALADRPGDIKDAARRPEGLVDRARLLRAISALEACGLRTLTDWVQGEDGRASRDALPEIVAAILARSLTDYVQEVFGRELDSRDGADLDRLRGEIALIDKELTDLSRAAIREDMIALSNPPHGNGTGKVGTYTEMNLIRHELNKKRNRIGVRDLTRRAGAALIDLKPCWMMSPLAVAQYLHGDITFDLVVIDEASQMTPENALGAIMRARQVVVVGDTKQLPPTNFFSKVLDDSDEDEDARTDSESILDMANTSFAPVRQLRWHYRSRHPDLIAISNKMIYDEKLTIFPAARDGDPDLGVELVEVEGQYKKGRNIPEVRAIVAGALAHMRDHPDRSLGLATMNKDQTDLIMAEFERERARHPYAEAFIQRWAEKDDGLEEFFVKNLETIQGDERDVIMISTLYGPDAATGKVYQRFGPVNSVHGHRRLNVLFSRAKEKIVTYSSMKPTDIQADGKAQGVAMLRAWLEFSRSGQINEIASQKAQTDSPFEDFVIAQIEAAGYEAVPQVGASGYRIDIGVRHPDWPYGFILAVECDGAAYHSSRSSRDRDRLRQEVLEGLGWHFHRIWSTDWFRNPRDQIEKLRAALDRGLARAQADEQRRKEARAEAVERARRAAEAAAEEIALSAPDAGQELERDDPQGQLFSVSTDPGPEPRSDEAPRPQTPTLPE